MEKGGRSIVHFMDFRCSDVENLPQKFKRLLSAAGLGEWLNLELKLERFAAWIRRVTHNEKDGSFINAFVTASLTVCVGAMAIVGSIEDGL